MALEIAGGHHDWDYERKTSWGTRPNGTTASDEGAGLGWGDAAGAADADADLGWGTPPKSGSGKDAGLGWDTAGTHGTTGVALQANGWHAGVVRPATESRDVGSKGAYSEAHGYPGGQGYRPPDHRAHEEGWGYSGSASKAGVPRSSHLGWETGDGAGDGWGAGGGWAEAGHVAANGRWEGQVSLGEERWYTPAPRQEASAVDESGWD